MMTMVFYDKRERLRQIITLYVLYAQEYTPWYAL